MPQHNSSPVLEVNLSALKQNMAWASSRVPKAEIAPVVKADAYGLGAAKVARYLSEECGTRTFFTAYRKEAEHLLPFLQDEGNGHRIFVLNGAGPHAKDANWPDKLRPVLNDEEQVSHWLGAGGGPCGLSVDIGMNRLGFPSGLAAIEATADLSPSAVELVVMHLSHGSAPAAPQNSAQYDGFAAIHEQMRDQFPNATFSLSASAGLALSLTADEKLVRPGIALFGGSPDGVPEHAPATVATLSAPVLSVRTVETGESVGYNGSFVANRSTKLAIVAIGYADGYLRSLANKGVVFVGGSACPVVGNISMDLITVDVTDAAMPVAPGARAEIFGERIKLDRLASLAGTIGYELLAGISGRVERHYTSD